MATSPFECSGLKRQVSGLYWVSHQTCPLHQECCQWDVGHSVAAPFWTRHWTRRLQIWTMRIAGCRWLLGQPPKANAKNAGLWGQPGPFETACALCTSCCPRLGLGGQQDSHRHIYWDVTAKKVIPTGKSTRDSPTWNLLSAQERNLPRASAPCTANTEGCWG